jgi:di/tricarboxylate transporter
MAFLLEARMMFTATQILLLSITCITFILIMSNRINSELVALMLLVVLGLSGLVPAREALSGFSSSVVITLIGLFVITKALEDTGVVQLIARQMNRFGGGSEVRLIILFMIAGAAMSLIMNNVAAGAVLLPAAVRVARTSKVRASKLLIPLSFGTLVGGMATYLTTANIVMSGLLEERSLEPLNMLDFIPTGALIVFAGVVYMVVIGRKLLPDRESITHSIFQQNLQETYQLDERMWEVRIPITSKLVNSTLAESGIGSELGLTLLAIWHGRQAIFSPEPDRMIYANDYLLLLGRRERIELLLQWGAELREASQKHNHYDENVDLVEVIIPPRSQSLHKNLTQLKFRNQFGVTAVALWREGRSYRTDVGKMPLQVGDALLVVGSPEHIHQLANSRDYLIPMSDYPSHSFQPIKALLSVIITAIVLTIAIADLLPLPEVMLAGAVAMVLAGCITMEEFYRAIEWKVIFLIAGMLPLSIAMTYTGVATIIGNSLVNALAGQTSLILVAAMFSLTVITTQLIGGQVSALLVGPIAINAALHGQINPQAMAVAVAIGCSTAFLTPIAHPVNILMMGPGGYKFSDFAKIGLGMTLVTLLTLLVGMTIFWQVR